MRFNRQHGFTLIELLLYVVIVSTLLTALASFFLMTAEARLKNQTVSEVDQQGTLAMQTIASAVRNANSISSPATGATDTSLTLIMPTSSVSPTVFSIGSGVLQIKEGTGAFVSLTNNKVTISGLSIQNLTRAGSYGAVQITFTVSRINSGNRNEFDYQKTFTTTASVRP